MQKGFEGFTPALPEGCHYLPGYFGVSEQVELARDIKRILDQAPLFQPRMPRTGKPFSVRMSNCGTLGWVSDAALGYRYQDAHPETGAPWPAMPASLLALWAAVAGSTAKPPEACLINYYAGGTKMGSHKDADEKDFSAPVVSVSLGDEAAFHIGGLQRSDAKQRIRLYSGDVFVLGGASRLAFHGIDRVYAGTSDLLRQAGLAEAGRINLTLRRVG